MTAPSPEEARQVEALGDAMEKVWAVLQVGSGESYSLDELSHLVYDPLPAPLTVKLPAAPAEVEGFEPGPEGVLSATGPSFWTALAALEGRWIEPDPLLLYVAHAGRSGQPLDLEAFLARPRRSAAPPTCAGRSRRASSPDPSTGPSGRWIRKPREAISAGMTD